MFSPSPSTSSGEAHDADDDEGLTIYHRSWTHGNHWTDQIEIYTWNSDLSLSCPICF